MKNNQKSFSVEGVRVDERISTEVWKPGIGDLIRMLT